ncbi:hypothetical protein ASG23_06980 [Cellulomonas sp. Leaf395]|nr:hypothetical protein ASG23_06980 [Cellulomonas sp. Leaf395]
MLRKTPIPITETALTTAHRALADPLPYQFRAVEKALDPDNLRPRILLADAVGLGKTLEIGMILSELARRGRGERILVVTPKHVLEQMQFELWTRFALPFVRLDSTGIQRIRQKLPANRNPFASFKRVIISIDTLKSDKHIEVRQLLNDLVPLQRPIRLTGLHDAVTRRLAALVNGAVESMARVAEWNATTFSAMVGSGTVQVRVTDLTRDEIADNPDLAARS